MDIKARLINLAKNWLPYILLALFLVFYAIKTESWFMMVPTGIGFLGMVISYFFPLHHLGSRPHRVFTALFLVTSLYCAVLAAFPKLNNNINIYISSSAFGLWVWAFTLMLQPYYFNTFDIKNHTLSVGKLSIPAALKAPRMQYIWLFLLFVLGLAWRWYGIYNNDPTFDENFHLYAAKDLQRGVPSDYTRAWLVNHSISWLYVYFNPQTYHEHVYVAKIPGIILSSLAIFPVYFLGRLLSPAAGLMAAFLWVVSPWGVGTSRVIREYAFYPVFITLEIYLTYILMQVAFLKKKISLWGIIAIILYLLFLSWYIFNIDPSSTIKIGLVFPIIAAVSFILVYADLLITFKQINWNKILYSIIPIVIATWILYKLLDKKIRAFSFTNPYENIDWFNTFLFPSHLVEHWWGDSNFIYLVLMVIFAGMSWAMLRRNRWFYIVLVSFMLTVVAYYWFFFRLFQIRYIYYALPLFCVVFAYGLIATVHVQRLCTRFPLRPIVMVASLVLGYFIFNPIYFTETLETYDPKYNRFFSSTKLVHFKKDNVEKFLARLEDSTLQNSGFVISNVYKDVLKINHNIPSAKLGIFFQNSAGRYKEMWKNLIRFDEGFIIFDSEIKDKKMGLPTSRAFTFLDWTITLEKNYPDCIIYRWRRYDPFLDAKLPRFEADKNGNTSFNETEGESTILFRPNITVDLSQPFSLAFWTRSFTEFPGSPYSLGNRKNEGILIESRGDTEEASLRFRYDIAGDNAYVSSGIINDGNWHHIVFYQKGGKVGDEYGIYVDGKKIDTKKVPREKNSRVEFIILNFIGETDDTRIYNFALDDAQVTALYNKGTLTTEVFLEANGKKFGPLHHYLKK